MTDERALMIAHTLHLVEATLPPTMILTPEKIHHIIALDCSGSMSDVLPDIRQQLKNKLVSLVGVADTVSIVWFSGRNEYGVLLEGEPISALPDLQNIYKTIDRWLKPVGLTGFVGPLIEVSKIANSLQGTFGGVSSLLFMSDGYDNQWLKGEILKAAADLKMASVTFCEFGYYADRNMLAKMAEAAGGNLVFAKDFKQWEPRFEETMTKQVQGAPKRELTLGSEAIGDFVYALDATGAIITCAVEDKHALVPGHLEKVYYLTANAAPNRYGSFNELGAIYAGISLFAARMRPDIVLPLLKNTGDARLINEFGNCFGKKAYSDFMLSASEAAFDNTKRLLHGYNPNLVPDPNAFTLLDLLELFTDDDRIVIDHPAFEYNRVSRKRVNADTVTTKADIEEIQKLAQELDGGEEQLKALSNALLTVTSKQPLAFVKDPAPIGYPYELTYNSERANINMRVKMYGTVALPANAPEGLPSSIATYIYRTFNIVKDGIPNVPTLVMNLSPDTAEKVGLLIANGIINMDVVGVDENGFWVFGLDNLPMINQAMVKQASAKELFEKSYHLVQHKAAAKVFNGYRRELFPRQNTGFAVSYGETAADWLLSRGITDYNGFAPKTVQEESKDFYIGKEMEVSLKQISAKSGRPVEVDVNSTTINEAKKQMITGTYTPAGKLMAAHITTVEQFLLSDAYLKSTDKDDMLETWLEYNAQNATRHARILMAELAQIKFAIIVGQSWFKEFATLDENSLDLLSIDGLPIKGSVNMNPVQIKI